MKNYNPDAIFQLGLLLARRAAPTLGSSLIQNVHVKRRISRKTAHIASLLGLVPTVTVFACSGNDGDIPATVSLSPECSESFSPTFTEISERVLRPTCGAGGSSCHSASGAQGGLTLDSADAAYGFLVQGVDGHDLVVPGDAQSSELMVRLETTGEEWSMPPGRQLEAGERCAIQKWINAGAKRD